MMLFYVRIYEHTQNACHWRSTNWTFTGYRRSRIEMPTIPQGASAAVSRGSIRHTSHMSSDAATAVMVEVAMAGGVELTTGSWLLALASLSLSSSDVTWKASMWASRLWLIACRSCSREYAPLSYLNARLDPHVALNVVFPFRPLYLNTTPDPVYIGHTCMYFYLLIVAVRYTRIHASCWTVGGI